MSVDVEVAEARESAAVPQVGARPTMRSFAEAAPRAVRHVSYLVLALTAVVWAYSWTSSGIEDGFLGFDFQGTMWDPAVAIREGRSPYPAPTVSGLEIGNPALYPPLLVVLVTPLTTLPYAIGFSIWTGILVAALFGTLYALEVRDARCYALAALSAPAVTSFVFGNATLLLVPLVALAWRWRDRQLRSGALVGVAIATKLFLWPLVFWLLGTRRYRAAGSAAAAAVLGLFVPWAVLGFDGLRAYPDLLRVANDLFAVHSFSIATVLAALGADAVTASRGAVAVGAVIAAAAFVLGRRGRDVASVSLAVLAAVLGSPILWPYYYTLLLVPLAIVRPRFSGLWAALPLLWFAFSVPRDQVRASDLAEGGSACCRPADVPSAIWNFNHSPPALWQALTFAALGVGLVLLALRTSGGRVSRAA